MRYIVTTAITAYQEYSVEAADEQAARDRVRDAIKHGHHDILQTSVPAGYNDDEQTIDSRKVAP